MNNMDTQTEYSLLTNQMSDNPLVMMHAVDMDGIIVSANPCWLHTLGYTVEEIIGTPSIKYLTKASRKLAQSLLPELLKNHVIHNVELQAATKNGAILDILASSKIIHNSVGKTVGMITSLLDITERKKAEEALRQRESYLTAIIENQPGLVWLKDKQSRFLAVNHAFALSCGKESPEALIGKTDLDIWPQELAEQYRQDDLRVMSEDLPVGVEEQIFNKGRRQWFETFKMPVKNAQGEIIGTTGFAHDITARKLEEEAMRNFQKLEALGILAGGIAHDFNNLLSGIFGSIDVARKTTDDEKIAELLSNAMDTIDRSRALTQQLLTFAKGGAPVKKVENISSFIRDTVQFAMSGSRATCTFSIVRDLWLCKVDKNQIGQVIDNLIINAQQAMPNGGFISVRAENIILSRDLPHPTLEPGRYIKIAIEDQGEGIPPEISTQIFDPFFTTKEGGHGLGLATCYSIIKRHSGIIKVKSIVGKGSTFSIFIPATSKTEIKKTATPQPLRMREGKVIVMDDEEIIRYAVDRMLRALGFSAIMTKNGEEAIDALRHETRGLREIKAIILDLTIPGGLGGQDIIDQIRSIDENVPVYVASGYADNPIMAAPQKFGFTDSIFKPFTLEELASILGNTIETK
ncbi:MAG: PAS domain S-box protein [Pontiellaceae bacterium]|nr:PAS domain S-box protein [Pontiellaceae bacterium]